MKRAATDFGDLGRSAGGHVLLSGRGWVYLHEALLRSK